MAAVLRQLALAHRAHEPAVQADGAGRAGVHAAQQVEHRGLAGAGRPDDDGKLPALDREVHAVKRADLDLAGAIDLADVLELHE